MVAVHADEVHPFVAGPAEQEPALGVPLIVFVHLRGNGVQEVVDPLGIAEILDGELPERHELGVVGAGRAPPGPALRVLVEGTENHRDQIPAGVLQVQGEVGQAVQVLQERFPRSRTVRQDFGHGLLGRLLVILVLKPGRNARLGVVQVHAGQDDLSPFTGFQDDPAPDGVGGIAMAVVHELGEIDAEHGGIVAADGLGVGVACLIVPVTAVPQVVVMAEHPAFLRDGPQVGEERLGLRRRVLVHDGEGHLLHRVRRLGHLDFLGVVAVGLVHEAEGRRPGRGRLVLARDKVLGGGRGGPVRVGNDPVVLDVHPVGEVRVHLDGEPRFRVVHVDPVLGEAQVPGVRGDGLHRRGFHTRRDQRAREGEQG